MAVCWRLETNLFTPIESMFMHALMMLARMEQRIDMEIYNRE